MDRRLVHGASDAIPRDRRRGPRQLLLHREFLAAAPGWRRRLFRGRRDDQSAPASLVAQHRGAVLSCLGRSCCFASSNSRGSVCLYSQRFLSPRFASVVLTPIDPIARFTCPGLAGGSSRSARCWPIARSFWLESPAYPSRRIASIGAGLGIALMLGAFVSERGAVLSGLARGDPDRRLRLGHRLSRFASRRDRAWQSRGRFLRRDLLSALSVALAAVRLRPHLARRNPDDAAFCSASLRGRGSRGADLLADRAAGRASRRRPSWSQPALSACSR